MKKYNRNSTQALKAAVPSMKHSIFSSHNYFSFTVFLLFNKINDMHSARVIRFHLIKHLGLDFKEKRKQTQTEGNSSYFRKGKVKHTIAAQHLSKPHPTRSSRHSQLMPTASHRSAVLATDCTQVFMC